MTWTQADHDHLTATLEHIELLAFTGIRETPDKRRKLAKDLKAKLETIRDIQHIAQNTANYIAKKIEELEQP